MSQARCVPHCTNICTLSCSRRRLEASSPSSQYADAKMTPAYWHKQWFQRKSHQQGKFEILNLQAKTINWTTEQASSALSLSDKFFIKSFVAGNRKTPTRKLRSVAKEIIVPGNQKILKPVFKRQLMREREKKIRHLQKMTKTDCSWIPGQPYKLIHISNKSSCKFVLKHVIFFW